MLALLPMLTSSKSLLDFVIRCAAYGLFATSLNLLVGYTGLVSFGHGMFFGLGAYGFGLIMQKTGASVPVAFVATLVDHRLSSPLVIGAICVRLKEIYFAFVTLAFQMLIHSTILSWVSLTGGDQGLRGGIPRPAFFGIDLSNHVHLYIASCALLVIGLLLMRQIAQSPFGYTLRMIRDNANRASFIGIDVWRAKLDDLRARGAVRLDRRHHHGAVRVRRLSGIRLLDDLGRGHLHQHARRRDDIPGTDGRHRAAPDPQRYRYPSGPTITASCSAS